MDCSLSGSSVHRDSPGTNTGVGSLSLLRGIFPTQGSNTGLLHCRQILYHLSHRGSPNTHTYTQGVLEGGVIAGVQGVITFSLLRMVYQFLFSVVTNNHRLHGLKQHKYIVFLQSWMSLAKISVLGAVPSLSLSRRERVSLPFPTSPS